MCVVSMVGDHYTEKWWPLHPVQPVDPTHFTVPQLGPSQADFDNLKREVLEMKELLKKAIKYDADHNQPECQLEEKLAVLRQVAKLVGVELDDVLKPA